jgi:hypothetical protein
MAMPGAQRAHLIIHMSADEKPNRYVVVSALGIGQIVAWGSTFYLLTVLAPAIARDTGWPYDWVIGGVSVGLLLTSSSFVLPAVLDKDYTRRGYARKGTRCLLLARTKRGLHKAPREVVAAKEYQSERLPPLTRLVLVMGRFFVRC